MEKEIIFLIEEAADGGYTAKALGHAIFTQAEDFETLKKNIIDAVKCHFSEIELPHVLRLHQVKDELISI